MAPYVCAACMVFGAVVLRDMLQRRLYAAPRSRKLGPRLGPAAPSLPDRTEVLPAALPVPEAPPSPELEAAPPPGDRPGPAPAPAETHPEPVPAEPVLAVPEAAPVDLATVEPLDVPVAEAVSLEPPVAGGVEAALIEAAMAVPEAAAKGEALTSELPAAVSAGVEAAAEAAADEPEDCPAPAKSQIVYASRDGSKYHKVGCWTLHATPIPLDRDEAEAQGRTPCEVCDP